MRASKNDVLCSKIKVGERGGEGEVLIIICLGGERGGKDGSANYYFLGRKA